MSYPHCPPPAATLTAAIPSAAAHRTLTATVTLPAFDGGSVSINVTGSGVSSAAYNYSAWEGNVLWDTGAFGQAWVPYPVFDAYNDYFTAALDQVR